jgi:polyhydroxybutyrate depolymerase
VNRVIREMAVANSIMKAICIGLAACAGLYGCGATSPSAKSSPSPSAHAIQVGNLTVAGLQRAYVVFRPRSLGSGQQAPLVIALHGYTVDSTWMETNTHFDDLAIRVGFVVVYPQGINNSWNAGTCCGHNHNDDEAFIKAVIDRLVGGGNIDARRVFVTGMSNGGAMAQRLACDLADRISAVASVSGSLLVDSCNPSRPISVMEMHGTADSLVPYEGGTTAGLGSFPPTMAIMKRWASIDGCPAPTSTQSAITTTYTWASCREGSSVVLEAIAGEDHTWFSPANMSGEPDATQVAWDFFSHAPPL